jgi:hypothetical protein
MIGQILRSPRPGAVASRADSHSTAEAGKRAGDDPARRWPSDEAGVNENQLGANQPGTTSPPLYFAWDVNGAGTFDVAGPSATLTWDQLAGYGVTGPGAYQLALLVTDGTSWVVFYTTLTVTGPLPPGAVGPASVGPGVGRPAQAQRPEPLAEVGFDLGEGPDLPGGPHHRGHETGGRLTF